MARSMKPVPGFGTMGPPPNPNPRPGGAPKSSSKFNLATPSQGQNKPKGWGGAGAGGFRGTSRVANALAAKGPSVPFRGEAQQVNQSRNGARGKAGTART